MSTISSASDGNSSSNHAAAPAAWARLARRIARRTTDLLAIALIAIAGLSYGGQLTRWWTNEPPGAIPAEMLAAGPFGLWNEIESPLRVEFGNQPGSLTRLSLHGSEDAAAAQLVRLCRQEAERADVAAIQPSPADRRLQRQLESHSPVAETPGGTRVYRLEGPLALVVAMRNVPHDQKPIPRILCWGMTLPGATGEWKVYVFHRTASAPHWEDQAPDVPIPPNSRRLLELASDHTGRLVSFSGPGPIKQWQNFYDRWFINHGWQRVGTWHISDHCRSVQYVKRDGSASQVDLQLARREDGTLCGLCTSQPTPPTGLAPVEP